MSNAAGPDTAMERDQKFEQLVERYQQPLLRMCCLYLCDKSLAEDAVQETFIKVYRSMDTFRGESSEKTWIMKIAMHICYDMNHSVWYRLVHRHVTLDMLTETAASAYDESDEELTASVIRLPRRLREVILLYYYQGMKVNEIADALGISHSTVSDRLKRGRKKLKEMLEGRELDE